MVYQAIYVISLTLGFTPSNPSGLPLEVSCEKGPSIYLKQPEAG
jgi:hypothetical protein